MRYDYFEGVLQLRDVDDNVESFVQYTVDKRDDVNIAKVEKVKNGFDVYLSSRKFIVQMGKLLQQRFGGSVKLSKKLHTRNRQTGKEVYRVTVCFRMMPFRKGDVIDYRGDELKVLRLDKKVQCKNIKTGKKVILNYDDLA